MSSIKISYPVNNAFTKKISNVTINDEYYDIPGFRLNEHGFRCDNFTKDHNGEHILFSGCSITFGGGLLEEDIWAKKVFNRIKENKKVSGYYNLALPGISIFEIVSNVFKYIDNFGDPNYIFICLPNIQRRYASKEVSSGKNNPVFHSVYKDNEIDEFTDVIQLHVFQYLIFLEIYCKKNNIKLYYFSWNKYLPEMELERLFLIKNIEYLLHDQNVKKYIHDNIENKNLLIAMDNEHFGNLYHEIWYREIYDYYLKELL